jgi:hypothetical protein
MTLAKPELTDEEFDVLAKAADVVDDSPERGASIYEIGGSGEFYHTLCYDKMGLASRVGDYSAEWLGKQVAEEIAVSHYLIDTGQEDDDDVDVETVVARVTMDDSTSQERREQRHVFYRVAVVEQH